MASLTLYPAIDLKGGACVRLLHGRMDKATAYNPDPASQAGLFRAAGFDWLHIVDLDGAFAGRSENRASVEAILPAAPARCQLGGGIRTGDDARRWLDLGVDRVILGTAAVKDPDLVRQLAKSFPGRIVVGIDAKDGFVMTEGWADRSEQSASDMARRFADCGVAALIYTDISRDGALTGVNVPATAALADACDIPVIASGGVRDIDDIRALKTTGIIEGVVIGRALYDGRLDPAEALAEVANG